MNNFYRQGDLKFEPIAPQSGLEKVEFNGVHVLAFGEATGHTHKLIADKTAVEVFKDSEGRFVLHVKGEARVTHEEHMKFRNGTDTLVPGWYIVGNEKEFDYFSNSVQKVVD